jgi:hypothetical protein
MQQPAQGPPGPLPISGRGLRLPAEKVGLSGRGMVRRICRSWHAVTWRRVLTELDHATGDRPDVGIVFPVLHALNSEAARGSQRES